MKPGSRPPLTRSLTAAEFASWYWLKEELVTFCRISRIVSSGSKLELQSRITEFLSGVQSVKETAKRHKAGAMPAKFTLETIIGAGWRCNPPLGAFLKQVCGSGFHFNLAMREFIHSGEGRTLADAAICYHASVRPGTKKRAIPRQLEYNQHFRDYFREHPQASRQQAIDAWWTIRNRRKTSAR